MQETKEDLLNDLLIDPKTSIDALDRLVQGESKYLRDLRINVKNVLASAHLTEKESALLALATAINEKDERLIESFLTLSKNHGATAAEIAEMYACASLLSTNNVFYRFKHFVQNEAYAKMPAGIKMNIMAQPVLGKEFFELVSLAISALNGCEACVNSHENSVRNLGSSEARIFDAIRLAAVIKGLCVVV